MEQDQLVTRQQEYTVVEKPLQVEKEKEFYPKGAIAFFLLFTVLMIAIWSFIYFIMIYRG